MVDNILPTMLRNWIIMLFQVIEKRLNNDSLKKTNTCCSLDHLHFDRHQHHYAHLPRSHRTAGYTLLLYSNFLRGHVTPAEAY